MSRLPRGAHDLVSGIFQAVARSRTDRPAGCLFLDLPSMFGEVEALLLLSVPAIKSRGGAPAIGGALTTFLCLDWTTTGQ